MDLEPINDVRCRLGESPYWWVERQQLLYVDVHNGLVHAWSPEGGTTTSHVSERVAFVVPAQGGELVLGLRHGLGSVKALEAATGDLEPVIEVQADLPQTALNDARCDRDGRLWFGTMDREERMPIGGLYRWDAERGLSRVVDGVSLANGIQFSPAGDVLYFVDSWTQQLDAFSYDVATGELGSRWTVVEVPAEDGMPDGINVDSEGRIYVALYGAACLHRYLPDGTLDAVIDVPVQFPTSCTFGGDDLRTLYVTSASAGHAGTGTFKGGPRPDRHSSGLDGATLVGTVDVPGVGSSVVAAVPTAGV
jgi:sugar lactone lactonase YvrE